MTLASVGAGDDAARLRPTSDRVRESIFNLLINGGYGDPITNARVLDLFAGTGALGLEALSRGATYGVFVDQGRKSRDLISENIQKTETTAARMFASDATRLGPCPDDPFSLIFLDPPYGQGLGAKALLAALNGNWITYDAVIVWEENAPQIAPLGFERLDQRKYGDTHITILSPTG
jgi:16S rRNA (guanine966-N2)-methyltransferase